VGSNNHVEVQIDSGGVKVFVSDPGRSSTIRLIADATFTVPLTRGLIWMEDAHYNAGKFNTQQTNTFSWDNVAFDGPVLARDLAFDVPDNTIPGPPAANGLPTVNLGYLIPGSDRGGQPASLTVPNVTGLQNATGAVLTLTYWAHNPQTLAYSVNGHAAHQLVWPFGSQATYVSQTVALPVILSELQQGNNVIQINTSDHEGVDIANIDLVLMGAGGIPGTQTPAPSPSPAPVPSPTNAPSPTPLAITDVPCTVVIKGVSRAGRCSGTFAPG
jgi:hypothetical protein